MTAISWKKITSARHSGFIILLCCRVGNSLRSNEWLWSLMTNARQGSPRSLMINEWMSESLVFCRESLICSFAHKKMSDSLRKNLTKILFFVRFFVSFKKMSDSLIPSFLMSDVSESLRPLTKIERCEQTTQVAHQNWATYKTSERSTKSRRI